MPPTKRHADGGSSAQDGRLGSEASSVGEESGSGVKRARIRYVADRQQRSDGSRLTDEHAHIANSGESQGVSAPVRPPPSNVSSIQAQIEAAKARAAALMARGTISSTGSATSTSVWPMASQGRPAQPSQAQGGSAGVDVASIQARLAEAKRRTEEMAKGQFSKLQRNDDPRQTGIHPLLMGGDGAHGAAKGASSSRHMAPKFSTLNANARAGAAATSSRPLSQPTEPHLNPYLAAAEEEDAAQAKGRARHRNMTFNAPGRHIRAAEEARREAQMEALKRRIEEQARKAGLEELTAEERALRRPQPPGVEWWDQALLPGQDSYDAVALLDKGKGKEQSSSKDNLPLIEGKGSPIDIYIQHPIPIPAPTDKIKVESKGVMLTKKEIKKMRRMRRRAELEDKQDKIKMGLLPPDPPKVKLSNLMRVLTSEAVADPTKVEARVRREVVARKNAHEQANLERMLTAEQRKAKSEEQKQRDVAKGMETIVFKIKHLVSPSHKFKVRKNAQQLGLTGVALFGKDFALVLVEGGQKGIKAYRHLMMNRINWQDPGRRKTDGLDDLADLHTPEPSAAAAAASTPTLPDEQDELSHIDWNENFCRILFQGPVRDRQFGQGFRARQCEADIDAKQALGPKMSSYWDLAKRDERANEEDAVV